MKPPPALLEWGGGFTLAAGAHTHRFGRLPLAALKDATLYPPFIKEKIFHLPAALTLRTEVE